MATSLPLNPSAAGAVDDDASPASGATFGERCDCAGHVLFVDARIRVYEKQNVTARMTRSCVARGRNLPAIY